MSDPRGVRWLRRLAASTLAAATFLTAGVAVTQGKVELDLATYEALKGQAPGPATIAAEFVRADVILRPAPSASGDLLAVDVETVVVVQTYSDGQFVPLFPTDALLQSVTTAEGDPLSISQRDDVFGARLSAPGKHEVRMTLRTHARRESGAWVVDVSTPSAPITMMELTLAGRHEVQAGENIVSPIIKPDGRFHYVAAVGGANRHTVRFRPSPAATSDETRTLATDATLLAVRDGVVEGESRLQLEVQGEPVTEVTLVWDGGLDHVEVVCDDVLTDLPIEGGRRLTMSRPVRASNLVVRYEVAADKGLFRAPQIRVQGADRQHGAVAVEVWGGAAVSVEGDVRGARAIDEDELPQGFPGVPGERRFAWKYFGASHQIALRATQYERREVLQVAVQSARATTVWTRQGRGLTSLHLSVLNNADQFLAMQVPNGVSLWSAHVDGKGVHPVSDEARVLIPLRKSRRQGETLLPVSVELILHHQGAALGPYAGGLAAELPTFELVVGSLEWEMFLPEGHVWYGLEGWESPEGLNGRWVAQQPQELPDRFVKLVVEEKATRPEALATGSQTRHRGALPVKLSVPAVGHRIAVQRHLVPGQGRSELGLKYARLDVLRAADVAVWLLTCLFFFSGFWLLWCSARERRFVWKSAWVAVGVASLVCVVGMLAALPLGIPGLVWPVGLGFASACAIAVSRTLWALGRLAWDATIEAFGDEDSDGEYSE